MAGGSETIRHSGPRSAGYERMGVNYREWWQGATCSYEVSGCGEVKRCGKVR